MFTFHKKKLWFLVLLKFFASPFLYLTTGQRSSTDPCPRPPPSTPVITCPKILFLANVLLVHAVQYGTHRTVVVKWDILAEQRKLSWRYHFWTSLFGRKPTARPVGNLVILVVTGWFILKFTVEFYLHRRFRSISVIKIRIRYLVHYWLLCHAKLVKFTWN